MIILLCMCFDLGHFNFSVRVDLENFRVRIPIFNQCCLSVVLLEFVL